WRPRGPRSWWPTTTSVKASTSWTTSAPHWTWTPRSPSCDAMPGNAIPPNRSSSPWSSTCVRRSRPHPVDPPTARPHTRKGRARAPLGESDLETHGEQLPRSTTRSAVSHRPRRPVPADAHRTRTRRAGPDGGRRPRLVGDRLPRAASRTQYPEHVRPQVRPLERLGPGPPELAQTSHGHGNTHAPLLGRGGAPATFHGGQRGPVGGRPPRTACGEHPDGGPSHRHLLRLHQHRSAFLLHRSPAGPRPQLALRSGRSAW